MCAHRENEKNGLNNYRIELCGNCNLLKKNNFYLQLAVTHIREPTSVGRHLQINMQSYRCIRTNKIIFIARGSQNVKPDWDIRISHIEYANHIIYLLSLRMNV